MRSTLQRFNILKEIIGCILWAWIIYLLFGSDLGERSENVINALRENSAGHEDRSPSSLPDR